MSFDRMASPIDLKKLQNSDGSFAGDEYGEIDTRFSYCAVSCASLLGRLDELNIPRIVSYIASCQVCFLDWKSIYLMNQIEL